MSAICQNFVQNAWKKELCSNCFKSKDEHSLNKPKPLPSNGKTVEGIIKTNKFGKPKRSVCFTNQLSEVIGYGGEDWASDTDSGSEDGPEKDFETEEEEEDEQELIRLTKANTDFNTNALKDVEIKKSYTQLMLGKPQVDSEGRKQTLLVSVTPFGQEGPRKFTKQNSHIPIAKNNKEIIADTKSPNIVLKAYSKSILQAASEEKSLLDEISETLENGKNPIQIISKKNGEEEKETKEQEQEDKCKIVSERKNGLTRAPVILKRDQEKPIISTAKIELMNTRNSKFLCKPKVDIKEEMPLPKEEIKTEQLVKPEEEKMEETECKLAETSSTESEIAERSQTDDPQPAQTREQAGEPDGRADPDVPNEPPALPLTPPPPLEMQTSFLHGSPPSPYEKPKVPSKPTPVESPPPEPIEKPKLTQQDSNSSENRSVNNKRRAPKPPEETMYARNSNGPLNLDCPVVREMEKRDRAASCSPKLQVDEEAQQEESNYASIPEPAVVRKHLSMSTDSLNDEKRKEKKGRFSLKKFLRISNSNKDSHKLGDVLRNDDVHDGPNHKPRLVIVHPLDLSGAKVEVVSKPLLEHMPVDSPSRVAKPPPPPRNLDDQNRAKPGLPTPPKSAEILFKQRNFTRTNNAKKVDSVYANIGEVRNAITPNKPQRTASMREREEKQKKATENYEALGQNRDYNENVYDYINGRSSSPEYDSSPDKTSPSSKNVRTNGLQNKRSESTIDISSETTKYSNIPRSMSLTYCGSETESEIYSPYSFYGSESEVCED